MDNYCKHSESELLVVYDIFQLCEGLLGLAAIHVAKENMAEAKKLLSRALELALKIFGNKHHFVASIFTRVRTLH